MFAMRSIEVRQLKSGTSYRVRWFNSAIGREDSASFSSLVEAQKFQAMLILSDGYYVGVQAAEEEVVKPVTLAEFGPLVISLSRGSARYKKDNLRDFNTHILPYLGQMAVADIGYGHLADWQNKVLASGKTAKSVNTYRSSILGPVFTRAMQRGPNNEPPLRTDNPLISTPLPRDDKPYRAEIITAEHVNVFFRAAYEINQGIAEFLLFILATGWRWSEAGALQVRAVDFDDCTATMERAWSIDEHNQRYMSVGKSKRSGNRQAPLPPVILEILKRLCEGKKWTAFVFVNPSGVPWPRTTFQNNWERILELAKTYGFPDIHLTPHGLRHSYLTALGKKHIGQTALQMLAGWADGRMAAHYTRNLDPHTSDVVRSATNDLVANVIPLRRSA